MTDQEIRVKALEIAELNTRGGFFDVNNNIIEFNSNRLDYLNAIENYIRDNNFRYVVYVAERELPCIINLHFPAVGLFKFLFGFLSFLIRIFSNINIKKKIITV